MMLVSRSMNVCGVKLTGIKVQNYAQLKIRLTNFVCTFQYKYFFIKKSFSTCILRAGIKLQRHRVFDWHECIAEEERWTSLMQKF